MFRIGLLLISSVGVLIAADQLPFTGTWRLRAPAITGQVVRGEVSKGVYTCSPCADPVNNMPVDGADHPVANSPDTYNIRAVGATGIELVRKSKGKIVARTIRIASDDGQRLDVLQLQDLPNGDVVWRLTKLERVGGPVAGAHPVSGSWKQVSMDHSSNSLPEFSYEQTADGLKLMDLRPTASAIYDAKFDGKDYPADDGMTVSLRRIDDRTIEESWKQKGVEQTRARMVISADGKTLTQTHFRGTEQTGAPQVSDRQPAAAGR